MKRPGKNVLTAFNASGKLTRIKGGQGTTYKAGNIILKPIENNTEAVWVAELMSMLPENGFRISRPIKTIKGHWFFKNWSAWNFVKGKEVKGKWLEKLKVSKNFHKTLSEHPKPNLIENKKSPWAIADKMVWGEIPLQYSHKLNPIMPRLENLMKPIKINNQLIHGDMTGNILFHKDLPPAIIDFSPYWHPAQYAQATIVIESIVWEGAPDSLLQEIENSKLMNQLIIRAAMWLIKSSEEYEKINKTNDLDYKVRKYNNFVDLFLERL